MFHRRFVDGIGIEKHEFHQQKMEIKGKPIESRPHTSMVLPLT